MMMAGVKGKSGGKRSPAGGRPRSTAGRRQAQTGFYPEDFEIIKLLVTLGYGKGRSDVIRRAIREALEREGKVA